MAHYDPTRKAWRIVATAHREGDTRQRVVRLHKAPNTPTGRHDAERAEARLRDEVESGRSGPAASTFASAARRWQHRNRNRWAPSTRSTVAHALDNVLLPALGERPYDAITTGELVDFYVDLEERYEPSTVRRYHGMISKLYGDLERLEELPLTRNPVRRLPEVPGGIAPKRSVPTPAEFARIVEAATDYSPAYATYLLLAAASGIRRGSMLALRWRDVDVAAGVVTVYQAVSVDETGEVFLRGTKSGSSFPVAILGRALDALREHRRRAAETALALGLAGGFDDLYVFSADGGRSHWSVSHPSHAFAKCARRVDLGRFRLHDVRHFAASVMLRGRVPVAVVAERLGCTEANVHRTYSHHFPTDGDTRAAEAMAAVL